MQNKKIRNATEEVYAGIPFKSRLECSFYKALKEAGLDVDYELTKFVLIEGFKPTVPFYSRGKKLKNFKLNMKAVQPLTYTPDFIVNKDDVMFIIEAKGIENDTYPIKRKLFRQFLENMERKCMFFEVHTKKELLQVIDIIKSYEKEP